MNDTQPPPPTAEPDQDFDPSRLRTIADMRRSSDDRFIGGVCAGAARHLNIDPVIVRVALAVLTLAGFAGIILYVAAWLLLPAEGEDKSLAARWFRLDRNEEQIRVAGLVGAVILAAVAVVGDSSWAWSGGAPWWLLPLALIYYLFIVRPRRRREDDVHRQFVAQHPTAASEGVAIGANPPRPARQPRSLALFGLTASLAAIALAVTWIYEQTQENLHWTTYIAVALAVVGIGVLIGTVFGRSGALIGVGVLLAIVLGVGSVFPNGAIGAERLSPTVAAELEPSYEHGIGQLELDLTQVADPEMLLGRTITLDMGIGQTRVIVPRELNLDVRADVAVGEILLLGRENDGTDISMRANPEEPTEPALTITIDHALGQIEVIER